MLYILFVAVLLSGCSASQVTYPVFPRNLDDKVKSCNELVIEIKQNEIDRNKAMDKHESIKRQQKISRILDGIFRVLMGELFYKPWLVKLALNYEPTGMEKYISSYEVRVRELYKIYDSNNCREDFGKKSNEKEFSMLKI